MNILYHVKCLKGKVHKPVRQQTFTRIRKLISPDAGILEWLKEPGEEVSKNESVAALCDLADPDQKIHITAPATGVLGFIFHYPYVNQGHLVGSVFSGG